MEKIKMATKIKLTLLIIIILFAFSGCTTTSTETAKGAGKGAGIGAGLGALAGAGIGLLYGDSSTVVSGAVSGAATGAFMGATIGGGMGYKKGRKKQEMQDAQARIMESEGEVPGDEQTQNPENNNKSQKYKELEFPIVMVGTEEIEPEYTREWVEDHWTYTPTMDFDQEDLYRRVKDSEGHWMYEPFNFDKKVQNEVTREQNPKKRKQRALSEEERIMEARKELALEEEAILNNDN